jgi:hypothetical protein
VSGFTAADAVTSLDFDFTAAPKESGEGFCTGKGVVAEPTSERLSAFFDEIVALQKAASEAEAGQSSKEALDDMRRIATAVCGGCPSAEEIADLPPRYLGAFSKWLLDELGGGDPKG